MALLTEEQIDRFWEQGYLVAPGGATAAQVSAMSAEIDGWIEDSRSQVANYGDTADGKARFDLEIGHCAQTPRLRRVSNPCDISAAFLEVMRRAAVVDMVSELIGHDVKFHHSKLNFKAAHGGEEVKWHQDIQFWPHTNYSPLTVGVFLEDVSPGMGNVGFVPGSHEAPLFDQYDGDTWAGCLADEDVALLDVEGAVYPSGPAGSITIHNCRTVHGSSPNESGQERPLLLQTYAAADAYCYTDLVRESPHGDLLIRGKPARWARHDPRPCQVGPSRVRTIFEVQQRESR